MDTARRERLTEAGWRMGGAADFLGLTAEETALVERRLRLDGGRDEVGPPAERRSGERA